MGAGGPNGAVGGFPLLDQVRVDEEVYEEGKLGLGRGGHCFVCLGLVGW